MPVTVAVPVDVAVTETVALAMSVMMVLVAPVAAVGPAVDMTVAGAKAMDAGGVSSVVVITRKISQCSRGSST